MAKPVSSRARLRRALQQTTKVELGIVFGVAPRTIARWADKGPPPEQADRIAALGPALEHRSRETRKSLKHGPEAVAELYGVSIRTARKWVEAGTIGRKATQQVAILEAFALATQPAKRAWVPTWEGRDYVGKISTGTVYTAHLGKILDPSVARDIVGQMAATVERKGATYQVVLRGNAPESLELAAGPGKALNTYGTVHLKKRKGRLKRGDLGSVLLSTSSNSLRSAIREARLQMVEAYPHGFLIEQVTLYERFKK